MIRRFAVYLCPPEDSPLFAFGSAWLGRNPRDAGPDVPPDLWPDPDEWAKLTEAPRFYGFHATLKPPFVLAERRSPDDLRAGIQALARTAHPLTIAMTPTINAGCIALAPPTAMLEIDELAARCVTEIDHFRRPSTEVERSRHAKPGLTLRQQAMLQRWGYPFVLEEFRLHMTLTGKLDRAGQARLVKALAPQFVMACRDPTVFSDLCLFEQASAEHPFVLTKRFPMMGARRAVE